MMIKRNLLLMVCGLACSFGAMAEVDCSAADVDQADSPHFAQKLTECESDPVILWDPTSKKAFFNKRGKVVNTYEAYQAAAKDSSGISEQIVVPTEGESAGKHYSGTTFLIREFFQMNTQVGPVAAVTVIAEMTKQMAAHCYEGWEKEREWTERSGNGYYLHYQFTCSGEYQGSE